MFYAKPKFLEDDPVGVPSPAAPETGFVDVLTSSGSAAWRSEQVYSDIVRDDEVYAEHNRRIKDLIGVDLPNPAYSHYSLRDPTFYRDWDAYRADGGDLAFYDFEKQWNERKYRDELSALKTKHPEHGGLILPDRSFVSRGLELRRSYEEKAADVFRRSDQGAAAHIADFLGRSGVSMLDPVNIATAPFGFSGVGTGIKGLAAGFLKSGAINAATEAVIQPALMEDARKAGMPYTMGDAAAGVAGAFVLGGALDVAVRGLYRTGRWWSGYVPVLENGVVVGYRKRGAEPRAAETVTIPPELAERAKAGDAAAQAEIEKLVNPDGSLIRQETLARADALDPVAIREVAEASGAAEHPVMRQMIDGMEANEGLLRKPSETVSDLDHAAAVTQSLRHASQPDLEPPPVRVDETPRSMLADYAGDLEALMDRAGARLDKIDPRLKEYVEKAIAEGRGEIAEIALRSARTIAEGRSVKKEARAFADKVMAVVEEVMATRGDPVRMARLLRQRPEIVSDGLPVADSNLRVARGLAALSDAAFDRVESGEADASLAALVAEHVSDPDFHNRAIDDLARMAPATETEARHRLGELLASPDYRPQEAAVDGPGKGLAEKRVDDPYGKDAKEQVAALEQIMAEELGRKQASEAAPQPKAPDQVAQARAQAIDLSDQLKALVREVIGVDAETAGVRVRVFSSSADMPTAALKAQMESGQRQAYALALERFMAATSEDERLVARRLMTEAQAGRGVEGFALDDEIWIAAYSANPKAYVAHELVHALRRLNKLTAEEIAALAARARRLGLFDKAREAAYRAEYEGKFSDLDARIEEEAAAHLIERYFKGDTIDLPKPEAGVLDRLAAMLAAVRTRLMQVFGRQGEPALEPQDAVRQIIEAFTSGEIAKRQVEAERSVAVAQVMRDNDLTAMAVRDGQGMAALSDIDMSPEARKQRAEAMGFDTSRVLYHGTGSDIESFSLRLSQDREGRRRGLGLGKGKIYLTGTSGTASAWAMQAPDRGKGKAPNVIPVYVRGPLIDESAWSARFHELSGGKPPFSSDLDMATRDRLIAQTDAWAKSQGFAGIQQVYRHYQTGEIMETGQVAIFDPRNIRSVNAAFDPRQSDSPNLMFALSDRDTGQGMRRDLDALGFYSQALEAARNLKQAKGTPEQMLAQLRNAGVKANEIEATGLAKFFADRSPVLADLKQDRRAALAEIVRLCK